MFDEPLMLQVNLPALGTIHPQSNKFFMGVRTKVMGDSKPNDRNMSGLIFTFEVGASYFWEGLL